MHASSRAFLDIDPEYAGSLRRGYLVDPVMTRIWRYMDTTYATHFMRRDNLLWFIDPTTRAERVCIPRTMVRNVLEEYHNGQNHLGFHRAYEQIYANYYIRSLSRTLRRYIAHCPKCLTHQTRRHPPYGDLHPVRSPPTPFHTIGIDFIVCLPESQAGNDACITTCKFSKCIRGCPGHTDFTAEQWAERMLNFLSMAN